MDIQYLTNKFNCNSSSSHGFAFVPDIKKYKDKYTPYEFGWDKFILATEKSKTLYMLVTLLENLKDQYPDDMIQYIIKEWLGIKLKGPHSECIEAYNRFHNSHSCNDKNAWLDHQSLYFMPYTHKYTSKGLRLHNKEFIREFYRFIMKEDLVIFGNNDNDGDTDPVPNGFSLPIPEDYEFSAGKRDYERADENIICRKDKQNYWTLFSMKTGFKMRFKMEKSNKELKIKKASAPELVDVKITEKCNNSCPWCYQDSKHQGKHCEILYIYELARELGRLEVFEVAIGGGEPTIHPKFHEILEEFRKHGIVPNFTTRRFDWINESGWAHRVFELIGKVAFSVFENNDVPKIESLAKKIKEYGIGKSKITIQVPLGTLTEDTLFNILSVCQKCEFDVSLLGYKSFGRGKTFRPISYNSEKIYAMVNSFCKDFVEISIDTTLAKEWEKFIKRDRKEWHKVAIQLEEGKFSCFIDAVNQTIGPCSYCENMEDLKGVRYLNDKFLKY